MLRCYELAHIAGVSKTPYVLATPRCLQWRRDPQQTGTSNDPADPDSQAPCRRRARRHRGDRRSYRLQVAGGVVLDRALALQGALALVGRISPPPLPQRGAWRPPPLRRGPARPREGLP